MKSLSFCLLGSYLSHFHLWRTNLLGKVFLVGSIFLSALWIYYSILWWPAKFLLTIQLVVFLEICMRNLYSLATVKFCLCLWPNQFHYNHFGLRFCGNLFASWTWMFKSLPRSGKVSVIIYLTFLPRSLLYMGLQWCIDYFS